MANNDKPFWCYRWHQQIFSYLCIHRYKKGRKQCEGCDIGKKLIEQLSSKLIADRKAKSL